MTQDPEGSERETGLRAAVAEAHDRLDAGRADAALARLEAALASSRDALGPAGAEAMGLASIAARALGRAADARDWSDRAIASMESLRGAGACEALLLASLLEDRAELELAARAPGSAAALLRRAIALRAQHGEEADAESWLALAEAEHRAGALEEALRALDRAEPRAEADGDRESAALALEMRGDVALDGADAALASRAYAAAESAWAGFGDRAGVVRCLVGLARAAERRDDVDGIEAICARLDELGERERAARLRAGDVG